MNIQKKHFKLAVLLILGMCGAAFSMPAAALGITLSWERPDSELITGYHIYYGPVGTNYRSEPEVIIDSPDQTQCQINDLEPGVTYEITAKSIDSRNNRESDFSPVISYTVGDNHGVLRSEYIEKVQKAYIAYYLRPADPAGLGYWVARLDNNNGDMTRLIEDFANSEESRRLWGKIDSASIGDVIEEVYWRLFDRPADAPGKRYYVNGFNEGRFTPSAIVLNMLNGARGEDAKAIENKVAYADLFVSVLDPDGDYQGPFEATYDDDQAARYLLSNITSESTNITKDRVLRDVLDYIAGPADPIFYD